MTAKPSVRRLEVLINASLRCALYYRAVGGSSPTRSSTFRNWRRYALTTNIILPSDCYIEEQFRERAVRRGNHHIRLTYSRFHVSLKIYSEYIQTLLTHINTHTHHTHEICDSHSLTRSPQAALSTKSLWASPPSTRKAPSWTRCPRRNTRPSASRKGRPRA